MSRKLIDSHDVPHKTAAAMLAAEHRYQAEEVGLKHYQKSRVDAKRKTMTKHLPNDIHPGDKANDEIVITEPKVEAPPEVQKNEAPETQFYCMNCGEGVSKDDSVCPACGIQLDWSSL